MHDSFPNGTDPTPAYILEPIEAETSEGGVRVFADSTISLVR